MTRSENGSVWKRSARAGALSLASLLLAGCYRGYKSPKELEADQRGPTACARSCQELGLVMSAFVLVENYASGCVCSPPAAPAPNGPAAAAATAEVIRQSEQQTEQVQPHTLPPAAQ